MRLGKESLKGISFGFGASALASLALGCEAPGERAATGECPEGEVCSDVTPDGLHFQGANVAPFGVAVGIPPTAAGGEQTIAVLWPGEDGEDGEPFTEPLSADAEAPFEIASTDPPSVRVTAEGEGEGYLRILEEGGEELFDRIEIDSVEIEEIVAFPPEFPGLYEEEEEEWALYAGGSPQLAVSPLSEDSRHAIDEGLELDAGEVATERHDWFLFELEDPPVEAVDVTLTSSAGEAFVREVEVVDEVDELEALNGEVGDDGALVAGEEENVCFAARSEGKVVGGLEWSYAGEGPVEVEPSPAADEGLNLHGNCAEIEALEPGEAAVTASAAELEYELEFDVVAAEEGESLRPAPRLAPREAAIAGERAASSR